MPRDYSEATDEELITRIREGESAITDYLMDKYKNLVKSKARTMYILGGDSDDLIQEGMIGLFKAVRDYDSGRDASFFTFADLCISRQMYTAITAADRKKHYPLNYYVSLSRSVSRDNEEGTDLEDTGLLEHYATEVSKSPEDVVIENEDLKDLEDYIASELSDFEGQVLDLYLTGMNYRQIAAVLSKDEKSTDNALNRIRNKLKRFQR